MEQKNKLVIIENNKDNNKSLAVGGNWLHIKDGYGAHLRGILEYLTRLGFINKADIVYIQDTDILRFVDFEKIIEEKGQKSE